MCANSCTHVTIVIAVQPDICWTLAQCTPWALYMCESAQQPGAGSAPSVLPILQIRKLRLKAVLLAQVVKQASSRGGLGGLRLGILAIHLRARLTCQVQCKVWAIL